MSINIQILIVPIIFILLYSLGDPYLKASAQDNSLGTASGITITINPGATDTSSQNPVTPKDITVPTGTTIAFVNKDSSPHKIASGTPDKGPSNVFYSDYFDTDKTYSVTLDNPGVYEYYDPISPNIKGQITVIAGAQNNANSQNMLQTQQSSNNNNNNIVSQQSSNNNLNTQQGNNPVGSNFLISGPLSSFISTPTSNWVVNGSWVLKVQNGGLSFFNGDMLWDPTNLSNLAHSHSFVNFRVDPNNQSNIVLGPDHVMDVKGIMDIGANNNIEWVNVPAEIKTTGNTITVSILDDSKTGNHFNNYPVFGKISHIEKCSDNGGFGANMGFDPSIGKCSL